MLSTSTSSEDSFKLNSNNEFLITLPSEHQPASSIEPTRPILDDPTKRILVLVGHPTAADIEAGQLLSGGDGQLLFNSLRRYGINRAHCAIASVYGGLPETGNKKRQPSIPADRLAAIGRILEETNPSIVLLLGDTALQAAQLDGSRAVEQWRGSLMRCEDSQSPLFARKILPTFHPRECFIDWSKSPLFFFDVTRLAENCSSPVFTPVQYDFELHVDAARASYLLASITDIAVPVAMDIEGGCNGMTCVSFATSPDKAFIVPFNQFGFSDRHNVLKALSRFLSSRTPKILQNQLYDNFVLSYTYRAPIKNVIWDTMVSGWEIYPELPKGLAVQTSLWTMQPYYKMGRKSNDSLTLHQYCCTDSAVTYALYLRHKQHLEAHPAAYQHFRSNMRLLPALLYMELRGIRYNKQAAECEFTDISKRLIELQADIDGCVHAGWVQHGSRGTPPPSVNVNSPLQVANMLYNRFGYPKQHPKKGREVDTTKVTTNVDALLELRKTYNGPGDRILELLLKYRALDKMRIAVSIPLDKDNRIRCSYNVVGTETGRLSCSGAASGSGANLTTITKKLRYLYLADDGYHLFQCDLSGADGWTVAAHAKRCGDPTMMDDYLYGLKPAKLIVLMLRLGPATVQRMTRDELKVACKTVDEDERIDPNGWQYFAAKQVQHGTNYGLGIPKMADNILKKAYKEKGQMIIVSKQECQRLQDCYLLRYPGIKMWQQWVQNEVDTRRCLDSGSGHVRRFFGRTGDHATHREAYAHEPQINTTFATNKALERLLIDPENRDERGLFRIKPVHHVHDALIGQFRHEDTAWAVSRIRTYFDNPMQIANQTILIPFEGAYGPSWGQLGEVYGGGRI